MVRFVVTLALAFSLLATALGHATAAHDVVASEAAAGPLSHHAQVIGHSGGDCDKGCETGDLSDCCGMTVAQCTGTLLGALTSGTVVQDATNAEFFNAAPALVGSIRAFDPPPPKA
ncbi:MAG: hypothetical protein KAH11_04060 [Rhodospirillales bacterium]|nr:hypothetical protein [Rhodospirillales bacterium]